MLIFHSINPGFDAEVTEKFLNGIYYSLAETEPWRNRWTFMDGFTVTTLLMLNCQSGCIFFWKTDLAITIQWTLDLRKILGVTKFFLKSKFFLISNTRKPLKKHNFAKMNISNNTNILLLYRCQMLLTIFVDIFTH